MSIDRTISTIGVDSGADNGKVPTYNSTTKAFDMATPSGGSSVPAWVAEGSTVTWSADNTDKTITLTNTGKDYYMLVWIISSGNTNFDLRFNSNSGANYQYRYTTNTGVSQSTGQTSMNIGGGGASGTSKVFTIYIGPTGAGATGVSVSAGYPSDGNVSTQITMNGSWTGGTDITSINLLVGGVAITGKAKLYSLNL